MNWLLFLLMLDFGVAGFSATIGIPDQSGSCSATTSSPDNFSAGSIGTTWQAAHNANQLDCPWSIGAGVLRFDVDEDFNCDSQVFTAMLDEDMGGPDQWACITYISKSTNAGNPGNAFRAATADASGDHYTSRGDAGSVVANWGSANSGSAIGVCNMTTTFELGDEFCARISGTTTNTVMEFWLNPGAGDPDDWGLSECCIDDTGGTVRGTVCTADDGDPGLGSGPGVTDSGNYAGVRVFNPAAGGSGDFVTLDDWRGGTCN